MTGIVDRLVSHGLRPDTPAALIASATLPHARTIVGTLTTIAELAREAAIEAPATLVVGNVVRMRERLVAPGQLARAAAANRRTISPAGSMPVMALTLFPACQ